tara:strand:- start:1536 stop:1940 length:405 start_codon:yes stop_codon:yes gene_type:complete
MMMLLLLVGHVLASGLPAWPTAGDTVSGECAETLGVSKGSTTTPLVVGGGLARCSFIAEPLSSYSHLLTIESHAKQVRALYQVDTLALIEERDYWRQQAERGTAFYRQPWFVAVTTSLLVTGTFVTYSVSTGGR